MLREKLFGSVKVISVEYDALIEALKKAAAEIKRGSPDVEKVFLFGSFARGNYTPQSDVDILIVVGHTEKPFLERKDRFASYYSAIPFDVNVLVYSRAEIKRMREGNNRFIEGVLDEAVEL